MIKQMRIHGAHIIDIAHLVGCSERTVRRHLSAPAKLLPFMPYVDQRLRKHVGNDEVIFREIAQQGYTGCRTVLRKYIEPKRALGSSKQTVHDFETLRGSR